MFGGISKAQLNALKNQIAALTGSDIDFNDAIAALNTSNISGAIEALDSRLDAIAANPSTLTLYVDPNGNNNNNGLTLATAFAHPFYACLKLASYNLEESAVLINIAPGTYNIVTGSYQIPGIPGLASDSGRLIKFPRLVGSPKSITFFGTGTAADQTILQTLSVNARVLLVDRLLEKLKFQNLTFKSQTLTNQIGSIANSNVELRDVKIEGGNLSLSNGRLDAPGGLEFAGANVRLSLSRVKGGSSGSPTIFTNASGTTFLNLTDSEVDWTSTFTGTFTGRAFTLTRSRLNYDNSIPATLAPSIDDFSIAQNADYKNTASGLLAQTKQAAIDELKNLVSSINIATITANLQLQNNSARIQDLTNPSPTQYDILLPPTPQIAKEFLIINEEVSVSNFSVNGSIVAPGDRYGIAWNGNKWLEL